MDSMALPMHLGQPLDFVGSGDKVNETTDLAPSSDVLFATELYNLLVSLEVTFPGSGKEITSILLEKATVGKIKKVKDYLKSKRKTSGTARKASVAG
jgi:hypothetical protein